MVFGGECWPVVDEGKMMDRRGFIGGVLGTVAATGIPFVAREPEVALKPRTRDRIPAKGKLRTYLTMDGVMIEGPELAKIRHATGGGDWLIELEMEKITFDRDVFVGDLIVADVHGFEFYRDNINFQIAKGDSLSITLPINIYTGGFAATFLADRMAEVLLEQII